MKTYDRLVLVTGIASCLTALSGLIAPQMYLGLVLPQLYYGMIAQDLIALMAGIGLIVFSYSGWKPRLLIPVLQQGLLSFLAYAYGIYSFEMIYTPFYFGYIMVLGLAVWSLVYGFAGFPWSLVSKMHFSKPLSYIGGLWNLLMGFMFLVLWVSQLIPLIVEKERLFNTFSIYVIDLAFAVPALLLSGLGLLRAQGWAIFGAPIMAVLGFGILSPLVIGELLRSLLTPVSLSSTEFYFYLPLAGGFLLLLIFYVRALGKEPGKGFHYETDSIS